MSAVMKEPDQELVILKPTSLAETLIISDTTPADFFTNPAYDEQIDKAIELTSCLVYAADAEGEKLMKADATSINKFAGTFKKHALASYKAQTDNIQKLRLSKDGKTGTLLDNRKLIIDQFTEVREAKLSVIRTKLTECLDKFWEAGVKEEFRKGDIEPMVIYSSLTEKDNLTAKAIKFCKDISDSNRAQQTKIESRHLILENRCLKEGIDPPLTHIHLGTVFYADDEFFNEKIEELIALEVTRKAEMVAKIEKENKAANDKKVADALKDQQDEANRLAKENAVQKDEQYNPNGPTANILTPWREEPRVNAAIMIDIDNAPEWKQGYAQAGQVSVSAIRTPTQLREAATEIARNAQYADKSEYRDKELAAAEILRRQADDLEKQQQALKTERVTVYPDASVNMKAAGAEQSRVEERIIASPEAGKRTVLITATFAFAEVGEKTSNIGVENFFRRQLSEKLAAIITDVSSQ